MQRWVITVGDSGKRAESRRKVEGPSVVPAIPAYKPVKGFTTNVPSISCYTPGDGGTWTFLRNSSTGDQGWVRDDLLPGYGSNVPGEETHRQRRPDRA